MIRKSIFLLAITFTFSSLFGQNKQDYYHEIPDAPDSFTAGGIASRMADGLGFRYYWATAGLRAEDLAFKPSEDSRTIGQTIDHIYNLTFILMNSTKMEPTVFPVDIEGLSFEEKRTRTLDFIKTASENLRKASEKDFEKFKMIFQQPDGSRNEFPFWNQLNGPMADAMWHVGQIVTLRRTSGNPFDSPNINVLTGTTRY